MKKLRPLILLIVFGSYSFSTVAQDTVKGQKATMIWVYTKEGTFEKGVLYGSDDNALLIYPGSMSDYSKQKVHELTSINYKNISIIKIKKRGGLLKGLLIGGGSGLAPFVFGQGGAFVAIVSFPVGIIVGTVVGATSKKKYVINGDLNSYQKFADR